MENKLSGKRTVLLVLICTFAFNIALKGQYIGSLTCFNDKERAGGRMYPYNQSLFLSDTGEEEWWDNLVEEIYQSGIDFSALLCRGFSPTRPAIDTGDPRKIPNMMAAMDRRGLSDEFKIAIFDDPPSGWTAASNYDKTGRYSTDPKFDCSDTTNYKYIWDYNIKEAIGNIPDERRFKIDGRMVIIFWQVNTSWMTNMDNGNLKKILAYIRSECQKEFGFDPYLVVQDRWFDFDSHLKHEDVDAVHGWFSAARNISWSLREANGVKFGVLAPQFYYEGHPSGWYIDPKNGQTLINGLENTVNAGALMTLAEGFTDAAEQAAFWRSNDTVYYDYPNQRINLLRRYSQKAFANHRRVQAESCDYYYDKTPGNAGGAFREGDLDIRKNTDAFGGWTVFNTEAGEWLKWKEMAIPENARFEVRYASTEPAQIQFVIDGVDGEILSLPSTGGDEVWSTARDNSFSITENMYSDLKIKFISGNISLNYFTIIGDGSTGVVAINSPRQGDRFLPTDNIVVNADAIGSAYEIMKFEIYHNNELVGSSDSSSVDTLLTGLSIGKHDLKFKAIYEDGKFAVDSCSFYIAENAYTISHSIIGNGEVILDPPGGIYVEGTEVTVTAQPGFPYFFNGWSGDTISSRNPLVITMNSDIELIATFMEASEPAFKINFQPNSTVVPEGYMKDVGLEYGLRENGFEYGWVGRPNNATRDRKSHEDVRYATLNHMQIHGDHVWEIKVANGTYIVYIVMGDPDHIDQVNTVNINGVLKEDMDGMDNFDEHYAVVEVTDNRLTIAPGEGAVNAKICFVHIFGEEVTSIDDQNLAATGFWLNQNFPNPFIYETQITFNLPKENHTLLNVYNIQGQLVKTLVDEMMTAGSHKVKFNAAKLPKGIYLYHLQSGNNALVKRMLLVK